MPVLFSCSLYQAYMMRSKNRRSNRGHYAEPLPPPPRRQLTSQPLAHAHKLRIVHLVRLLFRVRSLIVQFVGALAHVGSAAQDQFVAVVARHLRIPNSAKRQIRPRFLLPQAPAIHERQIAWHMAAGRRRDTRHFAQRRHQIVGVHHFVAHRLRRKPARPRPDQWRPPPFSRLIRRLRRCRVTPEPLPPEQIPAISDENDERVSARPAWALG